MTHKIEESIELDAPVRASYELWTQFEQYPNFIPILEEVQVVDDEHLDLRIQLAGRSQQLMLEICEKIPEKRIAWKSVVGLPNAGVITFHRLSDERSKVMLQFDYDPEGATQWVQGTLGIDSSYVRRALEAFRSHLEKKGSEAGSWHGAVHGSRG